MTPALRRLARPMTTVLLVVAAVLLLVSSPAVSFHGPSGCTTISTFTEFSDTRHGTNGCDHMDMLGGDDTGYGHDGRDGIQGRWGNDILYGNNHNDELRGDGNDDSLIGGNGDDLCLGGGGNDYFDSSCYY